MFDMRYGRTRVAALPAVLLALVSCDTPNEPLTPEPTESRQSLRAAARDFAFNPDAWSATAGEPMTITFANSGTVPHEWVLMEAPITAEADFREDLVLFEVEAAPGETARGDFLAPSRGEYQVICAVPGHFASGMRGTLRVE